MANSLAETPVILLAGGKSSRMGQPKGLVERDGETWLEHQLRRLAGYGLRVVILVLGYDSDRYLERYPWLGEATSDEGIPWRELRLHVVVNPRPDYGPFSSIQAGGRIGLALQSCEAAWVLPIDVPCPGEEVWRSLDASNSLIGVPTFQGRGGHPVRLSASFLRQLLALSDDTPDSRLDRQIQLAGPLVSRTEVADSRVVRNLNTPEDMRDFVS